MPANKPPVSLWPIIERAQGQIVRQLRERVLAKCIVLLDGPMLYDESPCWVWAGTILKRPDDKGGGYGQVGVFGVRKMPAHRVVYELLCGPIPTGLVLDHLCSVRLCVNPAHLEPVTQAENARRAPNFNALKTHCKKGHPFDLANTYRRPSGRRLCRTCGAENQQFHRLARIALGGEDGTSEHG